MRSRIDGTLASIDEAVRQGRTAGSGRANGQAHQHADGPEGEHINLKAGLIMPLETIDWVWPNWLARGHIHLLAGDGGVGKSTLAQGIATTVTLGASWPDGSAAEPGNALIWSSEESLSAVVMPRLVAMGADLSRVFFPDSYEDAAGRRSAFDPSRDMPVLERAVVAHDISLVILDPVLAVLPRGDSNAAIDVRVGMAPVQALAERTGAAVLGVTHLNKNSQGKLLADRILGSQAWAAVARCAWVVLREYGGDRRVLLRAKSNLGQRDGGLTYWIGPRRFDRDGKVFNTTAVEWGAELRGNPDTIADAVERRGNSDDREDELRAFVRNQLDGVDAVPSNDVKDAAKDAGLAWNAVERMAREMGVRIRKGDGARAPWEWQLPLGGLRDGIDRLAQFEK